MLSSALVLFAVEYYPDRYGRLLVDSSAYNYFFVSYREARGLLLSSSLVASRSSYHSPMLRDQ
jgi:hypothetical protein